jgi:hypothetical protein
VRRKINELLKIYENLNVPLKKKYNKELEQANEHFENGVYCIDESIDVYFFFTPIRSLISAG